MRLHARFRYKGGVDPAEIAAWRDDIETALEPFIADFMATQGYPPGANVVGDPVPVDDGRLPPSLAAFYGVIGDVSLPDVGNGHFIHAAGHVLGRREEGRLADGSRGLVFASDGGGILFAIAADGSVHRSLVASPDAGFEQVAPDLMRYLHQLRDAVRAETRT